MAGDRLPRAGIAWVLRAAAMKPSGAGHTGVANAGVRSTDRLWGVAQTFSAGTELAQVACVPCASITQRDAARRWRSSQPISNAQRHAASIACPKKTAEPQGLRCWHHTVWNSLEQLSKLLRSRQAGAAGARNPHVPTYTPVPPRRPHPSDGCSLRFVSRSSSGDRRARHRRSVGLGCAQRTGRAGAVDLPMRCCSSLALQRSKWRGREQGPSACHRAPHHVSAHGPCHAGDGSRLQRDVSHSNLLDATCGHPRKVAAQARLTPNHACGTRPAAPPRSAR